MVQSSYLPVVTPSSPAELDAMVRELVEGWSETTGRQALYGNSTVWIGRREGSRRRVARVFLHHEPAALTKRLKLAARVDYGMNRSSARRSLSGSLAGTEVHAFSDSCRAAQWCRDRVELTDAGVPTARVGSHALLAVRRSDEVAFCRQLERALQHARLACSG